MTDSSCYEITYFLKVLEHLILNHLEKKFKVDHMQIAYRIATGSLDAKSVWKETAVYENIYDSDTYCGIIDLSRAYDGISFYP